MVTALPKKSESRNPKSERNSQHQIQMSKKVRVARFVLNIEILDFEFPSNFVLRISSFLAKPAGDHDGSVTVIGSLFSAAVVCSFSDAGSVVVSVGTLIGCSLPSNRF